MLLWAIIVFLGICLLLLFTPIKTKIHFTRWKANDRFLLEIKGLFGLLKLRMDVPMIDFQNVTDGVQIKAKIDRGAETKPALENKDNINPPEVIEIYRRIQSLVHHAFGFADWLQTTLSHVRCTKLEWRTVIGVGEAHVTATTIGVLWGMKSSLLSFVSQRVNIQTKPRIAVIPAFNQFAFNMELLVHSKIRLGHAVLAGIFLLMRILNVKGGLKVWLKALSVFRKKVST